MTTPRPESIPDLWPDDYSARSIIAPEDVLQAQVQALAAKNPHLAARIKRTEHGGVLILEFMLSLADGSRLTRLCSLYHPVDQCYPVRLNAEGMGAHIANTQQQFLSLIAEVLRNPLVRSGVESLLAAAAAQETDRQRQTPALDQTAADS